MFFDPSEHAFARHLERHAPAIIAESARLADDDYRVWFDTGSYQGSWKLFPLFSREPWVHTDDCARNVQRCPETMAVLRCIPGLLLAGFSRLEPGTHIYPHQDEVFEPSVRCHLGLRVNPGARIRSHDEMRSYEAGRCVLFDGTVPHEAANQGREPRDVLLVDVARASLHEPVARLRRPLWRRLFGAGRSPS